MHKDDITLLAAVGAAVAALMALLGFDIYRAAREGPQWRRKLLAAGILLLATAGLLSWPSEGLVTTPAAFAQASLAADVQGRKLMETAEWKRVEEVWKEAQQTASGARGAYPFSEAGKKKLLDGLEESLTDLEVLKKKGLLSQSEAALLKAGIALLTDGVGKMRPKEMIGATCYKPMPLSMFAEQSAQRLAQRLPSLEKFASSDTIRPEVASKVLYTIERELADLKDEYVVAQIEKGKLKNVRKIRDAARAQAEKLRKRLKGR